MASDRTRMTDEQLRDLTSRIMQRLATVLRVANNTEDGEFDGRRRDHFRELVVGLRGDTDTLRAELQRSREAEAERVRGVLLTAAQAAVAAKEVWNDLVTLQTTPGTFTDEQRDAFCIGRIARALATGVQATKEEP